MGTGPRATFLNLPPPWGLHPLGDLFGVLRLQIQVSKQGALRHCFCMPSECCFVVQGNPRRSFLDAFSFILGLLGQSYETRPRRCSGSTVLEGLVCPQAHPLAALRPGLLGEQFEALDWTSLDPSWVLLEASWVSEASNGAWRPLGASESRLGGVFKHLRCVLRLSEA